MAKSKGDIERYLRNEGYKDVQFVRQPSNNVFVFDARTTFSGPVTVEVTDGLLGLSKKHI